MKQPEPTDTKQPSERDAYEAPRIVEDHPLEHMSLTCAKASGAEGCGGVPTRRT